MKVLFFVRAAALALEFPFLFFLFLLFLDFVRLLKFHLNELIIFLWYHKEALELFSEHLHALVKTEQWFIYFDALAVVLFFDLDKFIFDHIYIEDLFTTKPLFEFFYRFIFGIFRLMEIVVVFEKLVNNLELLCINQMDFFVVNIFVIILFIYCSLLRRYGEICGAVQAHARLRTDNTGDGGPVSRYLPILHHLSLVFNKDAIDEVWEHRWATDAWTTDVFNIRQLLDAACVRRVKLCFIKMVHNRDWA